MDQQQPANILIVHPGGLGDLVLLERFIYSLGRRFPQASIVVACREEFAPLTALYRSVPARILALPVNPYCVDQPSAELQDPLLPFLAALRDLRADWCFLAALHPTWLCWLAAAAAKARRTLRCSSFPRPRGLLNCLLEDFELVGPDCEEVPHEPGLHENARYDALLAVVNAQPQPHGLWQAPPEALQRAEELLREWGIEPGSYLICFPGGASGSDPKRWPLDYYRQLFRELAPDASMPILVAGARHEMDEMQQLVESLSAASPNSKSIKVFAGAPEDIALLAGLCSLARAFVGNDTGPVHLAQAFQRPGVAIFGGGTWPAYLPWAPGAAGLYCHLPCYGCQWDCFLGHGLCVESVRVEVVAGALREVMANPPQLPQTFPLSSPPAPVLEVIAAASSRYRLAQQDRLARFQLLVEVEQAARKRLDALHSTSLQMQSLAASREAIRAELRGSEEARRLLAGRLDHLTAEMALLQQQLDACYKEEQRLQWTLEETRTSLSASQAEAAAARLTHQKEATRLAGAIEALERDLASARKEITRMQEELDRLWAESLFQFLRRKWQGFRASDVFRRSDNKGEPL